MVAPFTPAVTVEAAFGNGPSDETRTWTSLAAYHPRDVTISRGRPSELDRFKAGSCSLQLTDNTSRDLDPSNLSGTYVETATEAVEYPLIVGALANEASTSLGTNNAFSNPADVVVGELLLAYVTVDLAGGAGGIATGSGSAVWTELFDDANGTAVRHALYARIATGSDALVLTGPTEDYVVQIIRIGNHGCATTADIEVGTTATGTSGTPNPPSLAAGSTQKWLWIAMAGVDYTTGITLDTFPTGFTTIDTEVSAVSASSVAMFWAYKQDEVDTLNPLNWGIDASRAWVANTVAVPPLTVTEDRTQLTPGTPLRVTAALDQAYTVFTDPATGPGLHTGWRVAVGSLTAAISGSYTIPVGTVLEGTRGFNFDGESSFQFGTVGDGASPNHDVRIVLANGGHIGWNLTGTTLTYAVYDGTTTVDDTVVWSDANHRYLRVRFDGDDVIWERSTNASSWTNIDTYTRGSDFSADVDWSYGHLYVANNSASTTPGLDDFLVQCQTFTRFTGFVDTWDYQPLGGNRGAAVRVSASDAFTQLAGRPLRSAWWNAVLDQSPTWFYDLGEDFNPTAADSSGNALNATVNTHAVGQGSDPVRPLLGGKSVKFGPLTKDEGIRLPSSARVTAEPYTWGAWVQVDQISNLSSYTQNLTGRKIFSQAQEDSDGWRLLVFLQYGSIDSTTDPAAPVIDSWVLGTYVTGTGFASIVNYWSTLDDTYPHFVTVTVSGTTVTVYIDGRQALPRVSFSGFAGTMVGTYIGNDAGTAGTPNGFAFPGWVDDVFLLPVALDYLEVAALYDTAVSAFAGESTGPRVSRILDDLTWPAGARRIAVGEVPLTSQDTAGQTALGYLQLVETTEGGQLFVGRHGEMVFNGAAELAELGTDPVLFDDATSGVNILGEGFRLTHDDRFLYTTADVAVEGGVAQRYENTDAVARYGDRGYSTSVIAQTATVAYARAAGIVERYRRPLPRLDQFTVAPEKTPSGSRAQAWADVLSMELGDTVQLQFQLLDTGDSYDDYQDLASYTETISGGAWVFTYTVTPRDPAYDNLFAFDSTDDVGWNFGLWR